MSKSKLPSISTNFTKAIATREYSIQYAQKTAVLRVEIGEPKQDVASVAGTDWRCPVRLTFNDQETIEPCMGIDSLQALLAAISFTRYKLEEFAEIYPTGVCFLEQEVHTNNPRWAMHLF